MARPPFPAAPTREGPRVNEEIRVPQVRVIDADGEMIGILPTRDALQRAFAAGLDLLEISPTAEPPVAKILDYGKFKYEQQKKRNEARKKQKVIELKEVKVRPGTGEHDFQTKLKAVQSFLEDGDKVKVSLRFKGREMAHQELGLKMLERIRAEVEDLAKAEQMPRMENRLMIMILAPK
ncbi:translation initiation factor IF-3 [Oecophyllibacter saccharovorans]|uniref:Translation initiation factor IF-3 n=1 Tax=Oecophyllibacter saccharovorans TaxID=2558360 RepID=A0A506UN59_9PROT|nr:translation initiation factor IF-3 [Oecophyllibacter saccharovorans]TPW34563.1 translation initiation factor IF-3 [Oecophyllibacter saccharovorans]TPW36814.1 translation initiation factor IF-3 [Oecophyllibacter saccharovorans]